jgi:hypothetical protein
MGTQGATEDEIKQFCTKERKNLRASSLSDALRNRSELVVVRVREKHGLTKLLKLLTGSVTETRHLFVDFIKY